MKVDRDDRRDCGYSHDKSQCEAHGCCFYDYLDGSQNVCFYPALAKCYNVPQDQRTDCGNMGQYDCMAKGCCYDSGVNAGVPWCHYDEFYTARSKLSDKCAYVEDAAKEDCGQNAGSDPDTCTGNAYGCCYNNIVPQGVPHCFKPDSECMVISQDQRVDCGFHGVTPSQCKEKGCCYQDNVPSGVPLCFYSKSQMDLPEDCAKVENAAKEDCGQYGVTAYMCREKGCCYNNYVPEGVPHCFKPYSQCLDINEDQRLDCGFAGMTPSQCKEKECCYKDNVPSGVPHCYYSKKVMDFVAALSEDCKNVENSFKEDCRNNSNDADACKANGCCYNSYVPEGVPHCYKPYSECLAINESKRIDCGFKGMTQIQCKEKQCCYQDNVPSGVPYCFYSKNQLDLPMAACGSGEPSARVDCGSGDKDTCNAKGCCFDDTDYSYPTKHCFYPPGHPIPKEACNKIRKEIRNSCGLANITEEECVNEKLCCYDEADNGTCFSPLTDKCSDVAHDKRFPCEQSGTDQMICEDKGCCHVSGAALHELTCFFNSGHPLAACINTVPEQGRHCGPHDFTRTSCEALGCCYFKPTVGPDVKYCYLPPEHHIPIETCNNIGKEFRKGCGSANITQEECLKSVCCYDEADNGTCFDPSTEKCSDVNREKRFPCEGNGTDQMTCERKGCCHDSGAEPTCFFHSGHPLAACIHTELELGRHCGPHDFNRTSCEALGCCFYEKTIGNYSKFCLIPPNSECLAVNEDQRIDCGFHGMAPSQCKENQCCYQNNVPSGVPHCFYSKNQMDGECIVNHDQRKDCGFEGMTQIQCKEKQCCYQDNVPSGVPHCFHSKTQMATFPTTKPSDDQCLVNQDQRIDCGFHGMTPSQCKEKQCCYQDNVPSGVPHCFHNKTQMDGECLVNQDQRLDCGFEGMTKIQCKEKQCCYQDNVPSGVPNCFYNKTYMGKIYLN
ncbi:hypothetical protein ACROYT_G037104 [Oculina patagonica]